MITREELRQKIESNLANHGISSPDIKLQRDPFNGWRLAVIAQELKQLNAKERKQAALSGIDEHFEWLDLLTLEEKEWAGPLPGDAEPSQLPLWPEALARGSLAEVSPVFSTDLDESLTTPIIVTFYSLRGGVGRSTALAQTGRILSEMGHQVVCVDMDLEAPGLSNLLGIPENEIGDRGVVSILTALDHQQKVDFSHHLIPVPNSEYLYLVPAGVPNAEYAHRLRFISPEMWYREDYNPLRGLLDGIRKELSFCPDVILLDARTGISEISGPLLFDLADMAVVVFFPHPQAKSGTEIITRGLLSSKVQRNEQDIIFTPTTRFLISPIPNINMPEVTKQYRNRPLEWISDWMEDLNTSREKTEKEPFFANEITHFIPYSEAIATSDTVKHDSETPSHYSQLADWVVQLLPEIDSKPEQSALSADKEKVLQQLSFSTGIAEQQENLLEQFIQTETVNRAMAPETALVLGRKGTGKTALFRKLSEGSGNVIIIHAPQALKAQRKWMLSYDGFSDVDALIKKEPSTHWRHFWCYYTMVAVGHHLNKHLPDTMGFLSKRQMMPDSASQLVDIFASLIKTPRCGLKLSEALEAVDQLLDTSYIFALDGLDTGFGSDEQERERRKTAIGGLLSFWTETAPGLHNITFKVFLREDIWKEIHLQNKSHLIGRSVNLKWKDQASYIKVALRQAMESDAFKNCLKANRNTNHLVNRDPNHWSERDVFAAWNMLVGERMKGGNTTFTKNWVWNRLADANQDRSPRFLLQLLHHALSWEQDVALKNPYARSIIRPRAMIACLEKVSEESLASIVEEFQELRDLVQQLRTMRRSPFPQLEVTRFDQFLETAREVGLLSVHEEDAGGIIQYKVPDFYRLALGIARKGQL